MRALPVALAGEEEAAVRQRAALAQEQEQLVTIATANTGKHKVAWYVGGKKVGSWNFVVTEG
jgi:hypothetical protein